MTFFLKKLCDFPLSRAWNPTLAPSKGLLPQSCKCLNCLVLSKWVLSVLKGIWSQQGRLGACPLGARMRSYRIRKFEVRLSRLYNKNDSLLFWHLPSELLFARPKYNHDCGGCIWTIFWKHTVLLEEYEVYLGMLLYFAFSALKKKDAAESDVAQLMPH